MQNETKKELHTQMWKIENPKDFTPHDREVLEKAAAIIRAGGLVAFPTETVYGLGANALDEAAAKKIYAAKGRPSDNPLIAHVSCLEEIAPLVSNMPENGKKLAKAYWPGPMTMVFPKSAIVPYGTTGGLDTVAIRMPSDPIAAELIRLSGVPIAARVRIHRDAQARRARITCFRIWTERSMRSSTAVRLELVWNRRS